MSSTRPAKTLSELLALSPELRPDPRRVSLQQWRDAVGERVAARSRSRKIADGVLTVVVASSTWAQELSLLSSTIISRLREQGVVVQSLRFLVGPVEPIEAEPAFPAVAKVPLPTSLLEQLDAVEDTELRAAIADAAAYSLGQKR